MHDPFQWKLGNITIYHEPVHVAQHEMYPVAFGKQKGSINKIDWTPEGELEWYLNDDFVAYDAAKELAKYPYHMGIGKNSNYTGNPSLPVKDSDIIWERKWGEFDAELQSYKMRHNMPMRLSDLSKEQKKELVDYMYRQFKSINDGMTKKGIRELIRTNDAHGLGFGGSIKNLPK